MHIHARGTKPNPEALLKDMEKAGVYGGCVFSNHPIEGKESGGTPFEERLSEVLGWTKGYEDRLFPVLWIHPDEENIIEKVHIAADAGIAAFKMICQGYYVYDNKCMKLIREIASLKSRLFSTQESFGTDSLPQTTTDLLTGSI